jgi:hypothetical protein
MFVYKYQGDEGVCVTTAFCCFIARQEFLVHEMDEDKMNVAHGIHVRKDKYLLSFGYET